MALTDMYPPDYRKMYESALGTVQNQYQTQRDSLNQQQAAMPYQYQQQRNQVAGQAGQTGQALNEANAQRGLYNSGTARTDLARNYAARDTGINDINNQQSQAVQALRNQMNQLGSQEANAISGLQGQEGQDARNFALSEAGLTGNYNGQQTLAGQQVANQASQFGQSSQLALLQALQNYNLGVGQVSDTLPQFPGYNYGDVLKQLLARLGTA